MLNWVKAKKKRMNAGDGRGEGGTVSEVVGDGGEV